MSSSDERRYYRHGEVVLIGDTVCRRREIEVHGVVVDDAASAWRTGRRTAVTVEWFGSVTRFTNIDPYYLEIVERSTIEPDQS